MYSPLITVILPILILFGSIPRAMNRFGPSTQITLECVCMTDFSITFLSIMMAMTMIGSIPWISKQERKYSLGKFEEALTEIRVCRQARMESVEFNYSIGTYANREDEYLAEKQRIENKDHEIEVAMEEKNVARIQEILSENYQRNRQLIYERIGLEIPEEYDRIE